MKFPKLEMLKYVFNRPEYSGAIGEALKGYVAYKIDKGVSDPLGEVESEVLLTFKDIEAERKEHKLPPLRVKTEK